MQSISNNLFTLNCGLVAITIEDEREDRHREMARDIALIESDPQDLGGWVAYLLEQMEGEAQRRRNHGAYDKIVKSLINSHTGKRK